MHFDYYVARDRDSSPWKNVKVMRLKSSLPWKESHSCLHRHTRNSLILANYILKVGKAWKLFFMHVSLENMGADTTRTRGSCIRSLNEPELADIEFASRGTDVSGIFSVKAPKVFVLPGRSSSPHARITPNVFPIR